MPFIRATVLPPDADEAIVEHLRDGLVKLATTVLAKASDVTSVLIEPVGRAHGLSVAPGHRSRPCRHHGDRGNQCA